MSDIGEQIEEIRNWLEDLQRPHAADPPAPAGAASGSVLASMLALIRSDGEKPPPDQPASETYGDLEKRVQEQTVALTKATSALKRQINAREKAASKLSSAYNDLEKHLQALIAAHSRENQRLQEQIDTQKRTRALESEERSLTEALRDTLETMGSTYDLDKILDHILDTVNHVTPYDGANVLFVESDIVRVVRQRGYFKEGEGADLMQRRIPVAKLAVLQQLIEIGKPLAIPDTRVSAMWFGFPHLDWVNSNVIAPIRSNGRILGFLSLDSATRGYFTQVHADRLQTFADQAAIAIQNARLLDQAKRAEVLAERNRLANELHDTISQTLWSLSLISERLPALWEIDQDLGRASLKNLHNLAMGALEEMRALLLELRPSTLADEKLGDLIRKVANVVANRSGFKIAVHIKRQEALPSEVHFVLYRVVQEALNNIVHHASAKYIEIGYNSDDKGVELTVKDDGVGFDPTLVTPSSLGLGIMKDRVNKIGGTLQIVSSRGAGTLVKVHWDAETSAEAS